MNIIEKTKTHAYHDAYTNEHIAKGGYLISDLVDNPEISKQIGGSGVGVEAISNFFADLAIPTGLYVCNRPISIGVKPKVHERKELIADIDFNRLLESVFLSKPRGEQTHKKKQETQKPTKTRKNTL
jgi:hypothetical protein